MASAKTRLRLAVLCSRIEPDSDGLPFALHRPLHTIRLPVDPAERNRPRAFAIYTQLEEAWNTTCAFRLQIRDEQGEVVYRGPEQRISFPDGEMPLEQEFRLSFAFPEPGVYFIHLLCDGRSLHEPGSPDERAFPPAQLNVLG